MTANGSDSWWTAERVAELKARWLKWETFTEIAVAIGHRSRNAVIGKAHRLGLRRDNGKPQPRKPREPRPRASRQRWRSNGYAKGETVKEPSPIFANPKCFIALNADDCRWPDFNGAPGPDLLCCAAPAVPGLPYCAAHCRISYAGTPKPKL